MIEKLMAWLEEAQLALNAGQYLNAISAFRRVQELVPTDASIAMALANCHLLSGNTTLARRTLVAAHDQCDWSDPTVAFSLGSALLDIGAASEAVDCFQVTVQLMPNDGAAHGALAGALRTLGSPTTAWTQIEYALRLSPRNPALLLTAAQIRHDLKDFAGALQWLNRAETVRPDHQATQLQRAYSLLIQGLTDDAWKYFDRRPLPVPSTRARAWHGEPLNGSTVLVTAEQGIGDQFQFARFVGELKNRGASRVVMECHADTVSLFSNSGFDAVGRGGKTPETDWHVPLLSLPCQLHTNSDAYGHVVPYLTSVAHSATHVLPPPTAPGRRRLGLVWAGNPAFSGRATRDLDPALLPLIAAIPGVDWISLQHGDAGEHQLEGLTQISLPSSWEGTASILKALDGLVTTDTGIAHLAGAMGIPTWVMLSFVPDWRWGADGETSAWYPTLRLIRQRTPLDWRGVIADLAAALSLKT